MFNFVEIHVLSHRFSTCTKFKFSSRAEFFFQLIACFVGYILVYCNNIREYFSLLHTYLDQGHKNVTHNGNEIINICNSLIECEHWA